MSATEARGLRDIIQILAGTYNKDLTSIVLCTVSNIENAETTFTIDCTPISGESQTEIPNVKLNAEANDGILVVPKLDSTVLIITSSRNNYYVLMCSDIEKIICVIDGQNSYTFSSNGFIFNDGNFGGMAKTPVLKTKYNNLETRANLIVTDLAAIATAAAATGATPVTGASLAGFINAAIANILTPLTLTTQTEIEDSKIQH